jgi:hypothetical protein
LEGGLVVSFNRNTVKVHVLIHPILILGSSLQLNLIRKLAGAWTSFSNGLSGGYVGWLSPKDVLGRSSNGRLL